MTGEMSWIHQNGEDSNGEIWGTHAAIARAVKGHLEPFDAYQGPYIVIGSDIRVGAAPYAMPIAHLGIVRLWLGSDDGYWGTIWREDTDTLSEPFPCMNTRAACRAARKLLAA